ncbi:MAG: DNA-directed RNA polymerase subunit alpha [Dehalococcoidales bacterium]
MYSLVVPKIESIEEEANYGHYVAEPLETGFGVTLGNSLRRIMLRYLPGAAVTHVWIDGINHEFSPIPSVKEDVLAFLMNVKELRLKPLSGQSGKLILSKHGEGKVYASDIEPNMDFEVVNPELCLATIDSPEGNLYVELYVGMGIGYQPGVTKDDAPVGSIPVDAIYSPVRKANFATEPMHVGRETSQERLHLEVWTDATITPATAVSMAADILKEQLEAFVEYGAVSSAEQKKKVFRATIPEDIYNMPIEQLNFSVRALNCLKRGDINTVGELVTMSEEEVSSLRNFGSKSRKEVEDKLKEMGMVLGGGSGLRIKSEAGEAETKETGEGAEADEAEDSQGEEPEELS